MQFTLIPVAKILENIRSPFEVWDVANPVTRNMVTDALADGSWALAKDSYSHGTGTPDTGAIGHARRIAWLIKNGWEDSIDIDVGIPSMEYFPYPVLDGHHRLCAAIMTGETVIRAQVSGALDYAFELFGVDCALHPLTEDVDV
jgi:hypothetical protein